MSEPRNANLERLEEIVAYLDGELSPSECARVEQRLASDEAFRQQLQGIERAWKALDELPLAVVDDKFAKTTMEMTVETAAAEIKAKTVALPIQRRRRGWSSALGAIAAAALGVLVVRLAWQNPNQLLLADLPVIDNVDIYSQFHHPAFLVALRKELGPQFEEIGGPSPDLPNRVKRMQTIAEPNQRDPWLRGLSETDSAVLRAKFNRFRELNADEQKRLRELNEEIVSAPNAAELEETMLAYDEWLSGLPPGRQFELRNMNTDERLRTIKKWAREMRDDAMFTLSEEELKHLMQQMREPFEELKKAAAKNAGIPEGDARRGRIPPNLSLMMFRQFGASVAMPGDFQQALIEALPERTREAFEALPPREKIGKLMAWLRQSEMQRGQVSQQELERFFAEELDARTREELLSLPPTEMQQAIQRLYRAQPKQGMGGAWWGSRDGRQGPGGPRMRPGGGPGAHGPRGPEWDGRPGPRPDGRDDHRPPREFGRPDGPERRRPPEDFGGPGGPRGFGPPPQHPPDGAMDQGPGPDEPRPDEPPPQD
jgi:hypothetical protein